MKLSLKENGVSLVADSKERKRSGSETERLFHGVFAPVFECWKSAKVYKTEWEHITTCPESRSEMGGLFSGGLA